MSAIAAAEAHAPTASTETTSKTQTPTSTPTSTPTTASLFKIKVSEWIGTEYTGMLDDIIRMLCIQFTIQIMLYFSGDVGTAFFTREFMLLLLYVELGILLYWLVMKKLVQFG